METKEYFEKVMQDFNQHRNGRSLRKYCQDEGIDYKWLQEYKRTYPNGTKPVQESERYRLRLCEADMKQLVYAWHEQCLTGESPE